MFRRIVLCLIALALPLTATPATPAFAQAEPASASPAMWLNVSMESPLDESTIKAEIPLAAVANLMDALPESVLTELREMKIPVGLVDIVARTLADADPLTILNHTDASTDEKVRIWTQPRGKSTEEARPPKILRIDYATSEEGDKKTELALPLEAVGVIAQELEKLDLPMELFRDPEEMEKAIEAVVAELKVSTPGDLIVMESPEENLHVWVE